jgi:hypothetical protein
MLKETGKKSGFTKKVAKKVITNWSAEKDADW